MCELWGKNTKDMKIQRNCDVKGEGRGGNGKGIIK